MSTSGLNGFDFKSWESESMLWKIRTITLLQNLMCAKAYVKFKLGSSPTFPLYSLTFMYFWSSVAKEILYIAFVI